MRATKHKSPSRPRVVVVGGGFAGLNAAIGLRRTPAEVIVVDRQNHHLFQPLLYQVATAVLSPADIAFPIRRIFREQDNTQVLLAEARGVDLERRVLQTDVTDLGYDYLVLAAGSSLSYFGHDEEWSDRAPGLKTIDNALEIRRRMLMAFETAELEDDPDQQKAALTFVVVGGGPTGVELAGALQEIAVESVRADFRRVDTGESRIVLVEGMDRLLPGMSDYASRRALSDLEEMGIEVRLNTFVTDVRDDGVVLDKEEFLPTKNVMWGAGVRGVPVARTLGVDLDKAGRVKVRPDLSVPGHPEVFVIGDLAAATQPKTGEPVPGLAPAAIQMGKYVGKRLHEEIRGGRSPKDRPAFHYFDKGTMATIGRARAVADIGSARFGGVLAWLMWSLVHVAFLIGFRSRLFVMLSWAWNYLLFSKGARLITGRTSVDLVAPLGSRRHVRPSTPPPSAADDEDERSAPHRRRPALAAASSQR